MSFIRNLSVLVAGFICLSGSAHAALEGKSLVHSKLDDISASQLIYFVDHRVEYHVDTAYQRLHARHQVQDSSLPFDQGLTDSHYWLAFDVENNGNTRRVMHLMTGAAFRPFLRVLIVDAEGEAMPVMDDMEDTSFTERDLPYRLLSTDLFSLEAGQQVTILIQYHAIGSSYLPLQLASPVESLQIQYADSLDSAMFYSFSIATLLLFALFGIVMSEGMVLRYAALFALGLLLIASMEGIAFQHLWPQLPRWNHYAPLVMLYLVSAAGTYVARSTLTDPAHKMLRSVLSVLVVINLVLAVASFQFSFVTLANLSNLMLVIMFASHVYAISTWVTLESTQPRLTLFMSIIITAAVLLLVALSIMHAMVPGTVFIHSARAVFLIIMLSTIATLTTHIRMLRHSHEQAMREAVSAAQRETEISQSLFEAEQRYRKARDLATSKQQQLAAASHDMRQPLLSLRSTIDSVTLQLNTEVREQLRNAFEYLDNLCQQHLRETRPELDQQTERQQDSATPYDINIILKTAHRMFEQEASDSGIRLDLVDTSVVVNMPATDLMRIYSNLISNALKHSNCDRCLLGVRRHSDSVEIQVLDNGDGIEASSLDDITDAYKKGADSSGEGLGLAICSQQAERHGATLHIRSKVGSGTLCSLQIPLFEA